MKLGNKAAQASVLALGLMLAACGGGGGVASTPTPTPAPTYTTLANLTGDRTFQTGGIHWQSSAAGLTGQAIDNFGSGVTVAFAAASGNYTVTAPGLASVTFTPADNDPAVTSGTTQGFRKNVPGTSAPQQTLRLSVPSVGGVPLNYLLFGTFVNYGSTATQSWTAVGGVPTIASDMPRTGTANYTAETGAIVISGGVQHTATSASGSSATFSANFATGAITTSVLLAGTPQGGGAVQNFGTFNGTGTITSGGPGFTGAFANTTGPGFSGAFFGPQALEMAYTYNFISGGIEAFGGTSGRKQ